MKKLIIACSVFVATYANAQLPSSPANTQYDIAAKIDAKAKQKQLGAIHAESAAMRPTAGKGGYFLRYEKGWVYYNPKTNGAYYIGNDVMKKWAEQKYETGWLGFPVSDNAITPNRTGNYAHFDNGSIYYSPATQAHFVGGAFREYWKTQGWENSATLGFPKTDEVEIFVNGYTRYQQFEKGTLFFAPGKPVVYSNNATATTPPVDNTNLYELTFKAKSIVGDEEDINILDVIDLYGWMDIRAYTGNGTEQPEVDGKSFSLFSIDKSRYLENETIPGGKKLQFLPENINYQRRYSFTQAQIDANAYVRITYWLNDNDKLSANDYLKLQSSNGSWWYNGGNHAYREIKLKDILRATDKTLENTDELTDGKGDELTVKTLFSLKH
jgi:hypothetical protein